MFSVVAVALLVGAALTAAAASGTAPTRGKPVIGKLVTVPAQPQAGKRFTVSFKVTRSDTGAALTTGKMICDPSVAGQVLRHAESFKAGTARLSFVVPANAAGKLLKVKVTIKAGSKSATKVATFRVQGSSMPSVSIGGASAAEGNAGTTTLSFPVTLSATATQAVSVSYATADGTATAPSDYTTAGGTLTFRPGEKAKTIPVGVVADVMIEPDETFAVTLSSPVNATIANGTATGTITNDDTAVPVTAGSYKGATQEGNYVFFIVTSNRTITGFRVNDVPLTCDGPLRVWGVVDWSKNTFTISADGSFSAEGTWTGSNVVGDAEWTHWDAKLTGIFNTSTSAIGTILINRELNYKGTHYRCSSRDVRWSTTLQS
jgi:hypothetical protein